MDIRLLILYLIALVLVVWQVDLVTKKYLMTK